MPLVFSAASETALRTMVSTHMDYLKAHPEVDLDAFAHTLQHRRSTLSYRTVITAPTATHAINAMESLLNVAPDSKANELLGTRYSTPIETPKLIGIFTGQGAQWARMGAQLIDASPFAASRLDELDEILRTVPNSTDRPSWTLKCQLLADKTTSRVAEAEISQPLCTAVQILLVEVLRAAGIQFTAVVGHSSGEIGAAYAAGLVSAQDALLIAFFRGVHAKLAASPNRTGTKGAMMAVGTSPDLAKSLCAEPRFVGRLQVAAVNSGDSVTLSGDEEAVDEAENTFKAEGTFARKLKVDTAYHSAHMTPCAGPYIASLESCGIQPIQNANVGTTWYSSVYDGEPMNASILTNQYWADNMCNAVLFANALARAVSEVGMFDLAVEVGPHPALKGPAMATLGTIPYTGLLSRGQSDVESLMAGLGFVWTHLGVDSVNFSAAQALLSGNINSSSQTVLTDLPSYPFDHSRAYWHDSRVFNDFRHRSAVHAPNTVLGMLCAEATTAVDFQWRNILKPSEVAWLKGHVLQGQALFPATGYVSQAIEAIRLAGLNIVGPETTISVFKVTDMEIPRALILDGESASVETIFTLSSVSLSSDRNMMTADWVCSSAVPGSGSSRVVLNAKGRVSAQLAPAEADSLPLSRTEAYNLVDVGEEHFYTNLARVGYEYLPPFRGVSNIRRKPGFSTGTLSDQSGDDWYDHLIAHPGMLDSALQTVFAAWSFPGDTELWCLHVPVSVAAITINAFYTPLGPTGSKETAMQYESIIRSRNHSKVVGDIYLHTQDGAHGIVQFEGVSLVPFMRATPKDDLPMFSYLQQDVAAPDGQLAAGGETITEQEAQLYDDMNRVAYWYVRNASLAFPIREREGLLAHFQHYLAWCDHVVDMVRSGAHSRISIERTTDSSEDIELLATRHATREDFAFIRAVGEELIPMIQKGGPMLDHMKQTGLLPAMYEDGGICAGPTGRWLGRTLAQISHRYPRANILEVGGGTGGTTLAALRALNTAYGSYTFTDLSPDFILEAESRFGSGGREQAERMFFKQFDMMRDPIGQGFTEGSYDVVVAAQVLHFSPDVATSLAHLRRLLKPGGFLVIAELMSSVDLLVPGMTIGTLPGWWNGAGKGHRRQQGPTLALEEWDDALRAPGLGFGGIDTATPDIGDALPIRVFVAQAVDEKIQLLRDPLTVDDSDYHQHVDTVSGALCIIGGVEPFVRHLAQRTSELVGPRFPSKVLFNTVQDFDMSDMARVAVSRPVTVLCLTDLDEPYLQNLTPQKFDSLKKLLSVAGTMIWVTRGAKEDTPFSYMMRGITMAVSTENPTLHVQMFDLNMDARGQERSSEPLALAKTLLRQHALYSWGMSEDVHAYQLLWTVEPEVYMRDGRELITRVFQDEDKNQRYNTRRRDVRTTVDVAGKSDILRLGWSGQSHERVDLELLKVSPLRLDVVPLSTEYANITVTHSLLQSLAVGSRTSGYFQLCLGRETDTDREMLVLSGSSLSRALVPKKWCIPVDYRSQRSIESVLISVSACLVAEEILCLAPRGGTLLVHDPDVAVKTALRRRARGRFGKIVFTTTQPGKSNQEDMADSVFVHPNFPQHVLKRIVPTSTAVFVHFSRGPRSVAAKKEILKHLGPTCLQVPEEALLGREAGAKVAELDSAKVDELGEMLRNAWSHAESFASHLPDTSAISLEEISRHQGLGEPLAVVDWSIHSAIQAQVQPIDNGMLFRPDRTYLFVGMAGELGQSLASWMMAHGARHIVLTSRSPVSNHKFMADMSNRYAGADIKIMSADVTSRASLRNLHDTVMNTLPPIAGVVNGAMVLADDLFDNMSYEQFKRVTAPKVIGTQLLDELFSNTPLDFFIVTTSITAVIGWSGQSNYSAANEFMTALVRNRRDRRGLAGSAINIPAVKGVGYAAQEENGFDFEYFDSLGYINVSEEDLHCLFAEAVLSGRPGSSASPQVVMGVNYVTSDLDVKAAHRRDAKFSHFVLHADENVSLDSDRTGKSRVRVKLQLQEAKSPAEARIVARDGFIAHLKHTLRMSSDEKVDESATLVELGVDSLAAVEIRGWFLKELEVDAPTLSILGGGSISKLIDMAMKKLALSSHTEEVVSLPTPVVAFSTPTVIGDLQQPTVVSRPSSSASGRLSDGLTTSPGESDAAGYNGFIFSPPRTGSDNGSVSTAASSEIEFDTAKEQSQAKRCVMRRV